MYHIFDCGELCVHMTLADIIITIEEAIYCMSQATCVSFTDMFTVCLILNVLICYKHPYLVSNH